jgi:hypothetical protein
MSKKSTEASRCALLAIIFSCEKKLKQLETFSQPIAEFSVTRAAFTYAGSVVGLICWLSVAVF